MEEPSKGGAERVFGHLMKEVLKPGLCAGCGACVAVCEPDILTFENAPKIVGKCTRCGYCYSVCPQAPSQAGLEEVIFEQAPGKPEIGVFKEAISARTTDSGILEKCQDGGVVSSVLVELLRSGYIDGAVLMGVGEEPWKPQPRVAKSREEILECAGTKYSRGPLLLALREAVDKHSLQRIAVVGTPCHVKAVRKIQMGENPHPKFAGRIKLVIGLFCMESFDHEKLKNFLLEKLGVPIENVSKFDIKKGKFIVHMKDGQRKEVEVKSLHDCVNTSCTLCKDFTSEFADISVGAVGSPLGRSTVLIRTSRGVEAFDLAKRAGIIEVKPLAEVKPGMDVVNRVSRIKKESAEEKRKTWKEEGKPVPP